MLVSIVILNWNDGAENCLAAVASAMEQDYLEKEILFVDNGSTDNSLQAVKEKHPELTFIETGTNLGCPGGRNVGASAAKGELVFFLETDAVWATNEVVSGVVAVFKQHPQIGALYTRVEGYRSRRPDPPIDNTVAPSIDKGLYLSSSFRGGASIVRRDLFNQIGQFPADFFRQYEERYLSLLIYQQGYQVAYWPEKVLRHKGSDYQGKSASVLKFNCTNELKTIRRLYPTWVWKLFFTAKTGLWLLRMIRSGQISLCKEVFKAIRLDWRNTFSQKRIQWQTLRHINSIRYGRVDVQLSN